MICLLYNKSIIQSHNANIRQFICVHVGNLLIQGNKKLMHFLRFFTAVKLHIVVF
jgi:hypothetical protein